jgi:hypothetical protein
MRLLRKGDYYGDLFNPEGYAPDWLAPTTPPLTLD